MALQRLEQAKGYEVADDSTDIRGWPLVDATNSEIGTVDGLLFNSDDNMVRYAIARVEDRCTLLPIGLIDIDEHARRAVVAGHTRESLERLEPHQDQPMTAETERRHYTAHVPDHPAHLPPDYAHSAFQPRPAGRLAPQEPAVRGTIQGPPPRLAAAGGGGGGGGGAGASVPAPAPSTPSPKRDPLAGLLAPPPRIERTPEPPQPPVKPGQSRLALAAGAGLLLIAGVGAWLLATKTGRSVRRRVAKKASRAWRHRDALLSRLR